MHAIATTPAGLVERRRSYSISGGLPHRSGRSAPALRVSRSARRSLTLWPACLLTPERSHFPECFSPSRYLLEPLQVLPVGATSYRAGFAPARINTPFTAHGPKRAEWTIARPTFSPIDHLRALDVFTDDVPRMRYFAGWNATSFRRFSSASMSVPSYNESHPRTLFVAPDRQSSTTGSACRNGHGGLPHGRPHRCPPVITQRLPVASLHAAKGAARGERASW